LNVTLVILYILFHNLLIIFVIIVCLSHSFFIFLWVSGSFSIMISLLYTTFTLFLPKTVLPGFLLFLYLSLPSLYLVFPLYFNHFFPFYTFALSDLLIISYHYSFHLNHINLLLTNTENKHLVCIYLACYSLLFNTLLIIFITIVYLAFSI
jgi:hypothetical protein